MKIAAAALVLAACATDASEPAYDPALGTPESPVPSDDSYAVVTRVQLTLDAPALATALASLRTFAQNPARAILAQPAGVTLASSLPANLRANLEGYLATELGKLRFGAATLGQYGTQLATIAETVATNFALESSLIVTPSGASHTLTGINFTPSSIDIIVPVGGLKADTIAQRPTADVAAGGSLVLGEQAFSLGFGSHAWQAVNLASTTLFGDDLSLLSTIDCRAIAQVVAAKCISGSCVGRAPEITAVCTSQVSALVDNVRAGLLGIELDELAFMHGDARLVDENGDGIGERIVDGTWDIVVSGAGLRSASATFEALDPRAR